LRSKGEDDSDGDSDDSMITPWKTAGAAPCGAGSGGEDGNKDEDGATGGGAAASLPRFADF
jgi:hypothetical protein